MTRLGTLTYPVHARVLRPFAGLQGEFAMPGVRIRPSPCLDCGHPSPCRHGASPAAPRRRNGHRAGSDQRPRRSPLLRPRACQAPSGHGHAKPERARAGHGRHACCDRQKGPPASRQEPAGYDRPGRRADRPAEQPAATRRADRGLHRPNSRQQPPRLPNRLSPQPQRLTRPSPRRQRRLPNRPRTGTTSAPTVTDAPATQPDAAATATGGDEVPTASAQPRPPTMRRPPLITRAAPRAGGNARGDRPAPVVADANTPIATQLRELANGKFDRIVGGKKDRAADRCVLFGAQTTRRSGSPTAKSTRARRRRSPISAMSMPTASIRPTIRCPNSPRRSPIRAALAEAEFRLTASVVTYAHHAQSGACTGRASAATSPTTVKPPEPADVLARPG